MQRREAQRRGNEMALTEELMAQIEVLSKNNTKTLGDLEARIDELQAKGNRMGGNAGQQDYSASDSPVITRAQKEHADGFQAFFRKGKDSGLKDLEISASMTDTGNGGADGGYAIPQELDRNIEKILRNSVAMRRLANVITAGVGYNKLVSNNSTASGWVGETDARPETATTQLIKLVPFFGEIYANPAASQNSLDDIFFDVESFIVESISEEFVSKEGAAFLTGTGTKQPKGLLSFPTAATADGVRAFGTLQYVISGDASAFPAVTATFSPYDVLLDLIGAVKAAYRQNASFLMNKKTLTYLRKTKTAVQGEYLIEATATAPATLWGYPIVEDEGMPDIGAGNFPVAFGDFKKAYCIVDVMGTRMLRDPYTNKPMVSFYTTKRVGSFLNNSEAVKLLKISAT